ncbi:MAG: sugar phosphate isomerase/epimerase [Planctomycetes bacterium]|nr:sugar phosphate isomerase/epimerase [Planctomycetota bacterium]
MQLIVFTKLLKPWNAEQLVTFAKQNGLAGFDLTIRDGYPVTPAGIAKELPAFIKPIRAAGLAVPMATVGGTAMPPTDKLTENAWAACAEAGIKGIKLGYWVWKPNTEHYWDKVKTIKKELAAYAKLSEKHGIKALFHTHSDTYYGLNASAQMHLLQDIDPKHVGSYIDPAHLALDGEPLELALDILRGRIAMVAVKNSHYASKREGSRVVWSRGVCPLHEGIVDWPKAVALLKASGYDGYLSVHGEYDNRDELEPVLEVLVPDIKYLRGVLGA